MKIVASLLIIFMLTGCAQIRELTMTKDELRLYGNWEVRSCLDPDVICIVDGS